MELCHSLLELNWASAFFVQCSPSEHSPSDGLNKFTVLKVKLADVPLVYHSTVLQQG